MNEVPSVAATTPSGSSPIGYANGAGLTKLLVRNFFLTLISLGFYRFWARARLRRYFWSNILVGGEPLEYIGTGLELFIGFLIAIAIIAPFGIGYAVLQRVALGSPTGEAILVAGYGLALFVFVQIVVFRARRYRLSRTVWRGIYAAQSGSAWRYLALSLLYSLVAIVTLGLAYPWRSVALERYKIDHSWFGESRFSLEAKAADLFPRWLIVMALLIVPLLAVIAVNWNYVPELIRAQAQAQANPTAFKFPHPVAPWLLAVSLLGGGPALIWYWVASFRYITSRTRLGDIRLYSAAKGSSVLKTVFVFGLAFLASGLAFVVIFASVAVMFSGMAVALGAGKAAGAGSVATMVVVGIAVFVPIYLGVLIASQLLTYWLLRVPILRHLATTIEIENLAAVDAIMQSSKPRQKFGIADSFDIGAI